MKKLFLFFTIVFFSCNSNKNENANPIIAASDKTQDTTGYAYKATYSSSFEMDDPTNAKILLQMYKDWDNNTLDNSTQYLADTLSFHFPDGSRWNGTKDSIWKMIKDYRNIYTIVENKVDAWLPFRTTDKHDHWVAIWAREYHTDKATGKLDSTDIHEVWAFNNDHKVTFLSQYDGLLAEKK